MRLKLGRLLGLGLLVGAYVPLHRLLDPQDTGPAGVATRASADNAWSAGLYGSLIVLGIAFVLSRFIGLGSLRTAGGRLWRVLERPSAARFAVGVGALSFLLTATVARILYGGSPTSVDELVQLLHASALADGRLGIPLIGDPAAWLVQNGSATPHGWASVYPPFHTILLAVGIRLGAPWVIGPLAIAAATSFASLSFEYLLGSRVGRIAGLMLALSPFWISLGATHLSHTSAAAALAATLWATLRSLDGSPLWALAAGASFGAAVSNRPWVGLVAGATLVATAWIFRSRAQGKRPPALAPRALAFGLGGLPFALLLFWWNAQLFGHPFRLGYAATFGPAHGLGLHIDPWGNHYGPLEALAYSGSDLVQLGLHLFETPLPAIALIGAVLILGPPHSRLGVLVAWALAVLGANALYWHHGIHMGPRMMYESVPAWAGLFAVAVVELVQGELVPQRIRGIGTWCALLTVVGGGVLAPGVVFARGANLGRAVPDLQAPGPAVVFVHGSWSSRMASRLAAAGMRRDSIETVLRRNDVCAVSRYVRWRTTSPGSNESAPPPLDLISLPGTPDRLLPRLLSPGNVVRVDSMSPFDARCEREARADRWGTIELESLLWRFPPLADRPVFVARDLGPATNLTVRRALGRRAFVLIPAGDEDGEPRLLRYDEGMELLWGGAASAPTGGG